MDTRKPWIVPLELELIAAMGRNESNLEVLDIDENQVEWHGRGGPCLIPFSSYIRHHLVVTAEWGMDDQWVINWVLTNVKQLAPYKVALCKVCNQAQANAAGRFCDDCQFEDEIAQGLHK